MFAVSLLALAASPHAAVHHKRPEPVGSLQGLFSPDDYPVEALDRNEQGDVGVLIKVDPTGAVSDCIIEHSASAILDTRTCELIRQRARFSPAKDRLGRPIASEKRTKIVWRMTMMRNDAEPSDPWAFTAIMSYAPDGSPLACRMEFEGAKKLSFTTRPVTCSPTELPSSFQALGPISQLSIAQRFSLGSIGSPSLEPDELLVEHTVLSLQIDATGKVSGCNVTEAMSKVGTADGCILVDKRSFEPRKGPDGKPVAFDATLEFRNSVRLSNPGSVPTSP